MQDLAQVLDEREVTQEIGVVRRKRTALFVESPSGLVEAGRAVSCLVEPQVGDSVLVAIAPAGRAWVLAVLDRPPTSEPVALSVDGDLRVELPKGRFQVRAEDVELVSTGDTRMASRRLDVHTSAAAVMLDKLTLLGRLVHAEVGTVKTFAGVVDQVLERFSQRVKRSHRFVEELDMTRAKQVDIRAEDNVHVRGHNTLMSAELLVKVDGEQIHLG